MKSRISAVVLVLVGVVIGCGAAAVAPAATSWAQPSGRWECFIVDRFPDIDDARSWEGAANIAAGLNRAASHVPAGTTLPLAPKSGGYASVACIKY